VQLRWVEGRRACKASLQRTTGERLWSMEREATGKQANREKRRHTAWAGGSRTLALILVAEMGFAQGWDAAELQQRTQLSPRIASELNRELSGARQGLGGTRTRSDRAIQQAPKIAALARVQSNGGRWGETGPDQGGGSPVPVMRWRPWKTIRSAVRGVIIR